MTCPRLPIVATSGGTEHDALRHAVDAIGTALASMIDDGEDIPRGHRRVTRASRYLFRP